MIKSGQHQILENYQQHSVGMAKMHTKNFRFDKKNARHPTNVAVR